MTKLWNEEGGYFVFDSTPAGKDTIMSDQVTNKISNILVRVTLEISWLENDCLLLSSYADYGTSTWPI